MEDVQTWMWSGEKLLRKLIAIDYETIEDLDESREGTAKYWAPTFVNNQDCWRLLMYEEEIVGYWSCFSLTKERFNAIKNGESFEVNFLANDFVSLDKPGKYNWFCSAICVKEKHRGQGTKVLLSSIYSQFNDLMNKGIIISEVCAVAFTPEGEQLSNTFGLKLIKKHEEYGNVYFGTIDQIITNPMVKKNLQPVSKSGFFAFFNSISFLFQSFA